MKLFPRGAWRYAVLLVILFSIAALATMRVIDFTTELFLSPEYERAVQGFSLAIWSLTMGLMFLAGALGLLAISTTAEYESRHRIAKIVNTMNYLSDGLLALDYQGYIKGANPAARKTYFAARPPARHGVSGETAKPELLSGHISIGKRDTVNTIFPSLTAKDTQRLLDRDSPCEIESEYFHPSGARMLRLRSQPVEGLILLLVSDITEMHAANIRQQQTAKLQVLGRIAGGVAHDFSNILSAISGHAGLIQRFSDDKRALNDSLEIIVNETQRGVRLSRQLLVLSRSSDLDGESSTNLAENIREAEELLRTALSSAWTVATDIKGIFPVVPLSPAQIVQIILNLGLLAADALKKPGKISIYLKQPDNFDLPPAARDQAKDMPSQDSRRPGFAEASFAAIITILASAEPPAKPGAASTDSESAAGGHDQALAPPSPPAVMGMLDTTGVIPSVVRTLIEEAGGRLDELYASNAKNLYRICLPPASQTNKSSVPSLKSIIKGPFRMKPLSSAGRQWNILLASSDAKLARLEKTLFDLGAVVERKSAIDAVLGAIDSERKPDVIIADKALFGNEANSLLKAVRKIAPQAGIIILSHRPEEEDLRTERGFVFLDPASGEERWIDAIVSSRQFAPTQK